MILHNLLTRKYNSEKSLTKLAIELGYSTPQKGVDTLREFMQTASIEEWLSKSRYDYKYSALSFVEALALHHRLHITERLKTAKKNNLRAISISKIHVKVETDFKRTSEQTMILIARQNQRIIKINKDLLLDKTDSEIFDMYVLKVKEHYKKTKGQLGIWGEILGYIYFGIDENGQITAITRINI